MNRNDTRNRIRGSLIGGAAGDALGYAIEFIKEDAIFRRYGTPASPPMNEAPIPAKR